MVKTGCRNTMFWRECVFYLQEGLRNADFSTTLTVFGLKPRSGTTQYLAQFRLWGLFFAQGIFPLCCFALILPPPHPLKIGLPEVIITQIHTNHKNSLYVISKYMSSHLPESRRQCSIITQLKSVLMRRLNMKPIFLGGVISLEVGKVSLELFMSLITVCELSSHNKTDELNVQISDHCS